MAISDKLNYLIETKQLFKDRLNSLGAEIIESTTFRNYLNWLDNMYNKVSDKTDLAKNGIVGRTSQDSTLPSEYTRVDYIESSGTQYIDTGYLINGNLKVETDIEYTSSINVNNYIFGGREAYDKNNYSLLLQSKGTSFRNDYASTATQASPTISNLITKWHIIKNKGTLTITSGDNQNIAQTTSNATFSSNYNIYIFACNHAGSTLNMSSYRLYGFKMYDNDVLVRDFIPCYRNSDNVVGLYDIVNNVFYTNQGTGVFTYGSIVTEPSPDYPLEIKNLSGEVSYKVSGKNLFDKDTDDFEKGYYLDVNGEKKLSANWGIYDVKVLPNEIYTISGTIQNNGAYFWWSDSNKNLISLISSHRNITATSPINAKYISMSIVWNKTSSAYDENTFMLEQGSTATDYEPYIEPRTFPLSLKSKNLFDKDNISNNEWLLANGTTESHNDFCVSDYIPIKENTDYYLPMTNTRRLKYYNSEKQPLTTSDWDIARSTVGQVITTPNNANYVRITIQYTVVDINTFQFEENPISTDFEPYYDIELCEIGSYKDYIKKSIGKNLFDNFFRDEENGGVYNKSTNSYTSTVRTGVNAWVFKKEIEQGKTYTISCSKQTNAEFRYVLSNNDLANGQTIVGSTNTVINNVATFTNSSNYKYLYISFRTSTTGTEAILSDVQIEENSTATDFEPYGNEFYMRKQNKKELLSFTGGSIEENGIRLTPILTSKPISAYTILYCTHFINATSYNQCVNHSGTTPNRLGMNANGQIICNVDGYTTRDEYLNLFNNNDVYLYYPPELPTTEEITEESYPTLYGQLKDIRDYLVQYKINNEFLLDYSSPEIEY